MALKYFFWLLLMVLGPFCFGQDVEGIPANGLVGYWPFNGNANDEAGYDQHGKVNGATLTNDRYGQLDASYYFSDVDQSIEIPDGRFAPFFGDFTIFFWFKSDYRERMQPFNMNDSSKFMSNLNFSFNNKAGCWTYWNSGGYRNIMSGDIREFTDNFWHNLLFKREGSTLKIYFDGVVRGVYENFVGAVGSGNGITISGGDYPWFGVIDDLIIYERALNEAEILQLTDQPKITITSPISNNAFSIGSTAKITWLKPRDVGPVKVEYSVNEGLTWHEIGTASSLASSYDWLIPNLPDHKCLIKIEETEEPFRIAVSDTFLISKYRWELVNRSAEFSIRDGAGAYVMNDKMYLVGGWNPYDPENYPLVTNSEVWQSQDGLHWDLAANAPWEPRHTFGALVFQNKMWVLGGDQLQCGFQTDIWSSDDGAIWDLVNEHAPWGERMLHMSFVYDGKMWVMGGQKIVYCDNTDEVVYNDVWNSNDGVNWNLVTETAGWSPRGMIGGSCVYDNKMWILGGGIYQRKFYNDVWSSQDGVTWTLVSEDAPWFPRQYHSVAVFDSLMWVMEGFNEHNRNGVWHSKDGHKWYNLLGTPWGPRHASSLFNYANSLWIVAGNMWNDVWRLKSVSCPVISTQPKDQILNSGDTATWSIAFSTPSPNYQWQVHDGLGWTNLRDNEHIVGSMSKTLVINDVSTSDNGAKFRCLAWEGNCRDTTQVVSLTVCPRFELQPDDEIVLEGGKATFHVRHSDSDGLYQWQINDGSGWTNLENGAEYSGVLTSTLTIEAVSLFNHGQQYRNAILTSGGGCEVISNAAKLIVCGSIREHPKDQFVSAGETATFLVSHSDSTITFQWQVNTSDGWKDLENDAQYSGVSTSSLMVSNAPFLHYAQEFRNVMRKASGDCKTVSSEATLTICPSFDEQPNDQTIIYHDYAVFTVKSSAIDVTYQWQTKVGFDWVNLFDSEEYTGTTSESLLISGIEIRQDGQEFRCIIGRNGCRRASEVATLKMLPKIGVYPNPFDDFITIALDSDFSNMTYHISNQLGQIVLEGVLTNRVSQLNLGRLRGGIYCLELGSKRHMFKLIKR